jgi:Tfp pilus assembly protein PilW
MNGPVDGQARGFTVVEMLIALGIILSIAGTVASLVPPARAVFDRVPADLDLQQRGRTAIDVLSQALRSAGKDVAATAGLGSLADILPALTVADSADGGSTFRSITVIVPVLNGAQGVSEAAQSTSAAAITLATSPCPNVKDVCGFVTGTTAVIADGNGARDVFVVASTSAGARRLTPNHALSRAYPAGSAVVEVDADTFKLADQADGSSSLIRQTAAGAIQPIVDFIDELTFTVSGDAVPAGFLRLRQIDIAVRVQAATESMRLVVSDRVFRTAIRVRNAS